MNENGETPQQTATRLIAESRKTVCGKVHWRWAERPGRVAASSDAAPPEIRALYDAGQQCLGCKWFVPLAGTVGMDWGVCANVESEHDATLMFEHDTCLKRTPGQSEKWNGGEYA